MLSLHIQSFIRFFVIMLLRWLDFHRNISCLWYSVENSGHTVAEIVPIFFLSGFSLTDTHNSHDSRGRKGSIFYSTLPLLLALENSDIYLQLRTWDGYHIFLIATLVFTRLLLDEIYHLIELLFNWLMMWYWFLFTCLLNSF